MDFILPAPSRYRRVVRDVTVVAPGFPPAQAIVAPQVAPAAPVIIEERRVETIRRVLRPGLTGCNNQRPSWPFRAQGESVFGVPLIGAQVIVAYPRKDHHKWLSPLLCTSQRHLNGVGDSPRQHGDHKPRRRRDHSRQRRRRRVSGGTPTVANTSLIQIFGQGGNDTLTLKRGERRAAAANQFGGAGNEP